MSSADNTRIYTAVITNWLDPDCSPWITAFSSQENRDAFIRTARERIALAGKEDELTVCGDSGALDETDYLSYLPAPVYVFEDEPWVLTDEDSMQHVRKLRMDTYELMQYSLLNPDTMIFGVFTDTVHLPDYAGDEMLMILNTFGYKSLAQVEAEYGAEAYKQIAAECIFEHYLDSANEPIYCGTKEEVTSFITDMLACCEMKHTPDLPTEDRT